MLLAALLPVLGASALAYGSFGAAPHAATARGSRAAAVIMQQNNIGLAGAATAAATVLEEVSRSVGEKGVEAPDADQSFVSMASERAGLVDEEGLPLVYDREAIQKYFKSPRADREGEPQVNEAPHYPESLRRFC